MCRLQSLTSGLLLLAAGCTAQVYHPTKSASEMQADIKLCTSRANHDYWFDPIAALYHAYDCLEAKGYRRSKGDFASKVERAFGEAESARRAEAGPALPCHVPCPPGKPPPRQ
ncbi:MAG: hypothetical protein JWO25_2745 [Alphaproteobacteria bacterium]|nr:hypothetical protein [Alphaproteobacteria bacterium]